MSSEDPELATKAPESDAMQDQPDPLSTLTPESRMNTIDLDLSPSELSQAKSQSQPESQPQPEPPSSNDQFSHCTTDRPLPQSSTQPTGILTTLASIPTYISKPESYPSKPAKLLLLLTGGTGIHSVNNQLQADLFSQQNYIVIMPDQFSSDPAPPSATTATTITPSTSTSGTNQTPSFLESALSTVQSTIASTAKSFSIDMWLARHTPSRVLPVLHKVLTACHDEYADSVAYGGGIYGVGYCFGARYIILLSGNIHDADDISRAQRTTSQGGPKPTWLPALKASAVAHATLVEKEELRAVQAPLYVVAVQDDPLFPEETLDYGRKVWASDGSVECKVEVVEGVPHGFAVVGEYEDQKIRAEQEKAFQGMCEWLDSH